MPNATKRSTFNQNNNLYLKTETKFKSTKGNVHFLMQRLRKKEQKDSKEKFFLIVATIGFFIISGIVISF